MTDDTTKGRGERPDVLRRGAVAVIDALGFKGIWTREKPREVLETLKALRFVSDGHTAVASEVIAPVRAQFFSDGIVITAEATTERAEDAGKPGSMAAAVTAVCVAALNVTSRATSLSVPLLYRGSVAAGDILVDGDFFVGRAIDEAAQWAEQADAAVVWLQPSARSAFLPGWETAQALVEWDVPLKGKTAPLRTLIVNPLGFLDLRGNKLWERDMESLRFAYIKAFGSNTSNLDIAIKLQNTERALDAGAKAIRDRVEKMGNSNA